MIDLKGIVGMSLDRMGVRTQPDLTHLRNKYAPRPTLTGYTTPAGSKDINALCDAYDRVLREVRKPRKCSTCGTPLGTECDSCRRLWES